MSVDAPCPWPGLIAYEEKDRGFFTGRDTEITALLGAIRRAPLTVLFGQSGLGKTSLIQAGLFPRLREDGGFPVWIRLSFDPKAPSLTEQVLQKIGEASDNTRRLYPDRPELHILPPAFDDEISSRRTLWEYFHRRDGYFWGARNRLVTPVIVLDQFEEWFTQGAILSTEQRRRFLDELHQLLDNDPPADLDPTTGWNLERVPLAVMISLREDYLAHLGELREFLPGLRESDLRLVPLSEAQAREVIEKPAPWPADPAFTAAALDSLRQAAREPVATAVPLGADTDYDPAILSLLLSRLFDSLRHAETGEARAGIVRQKGQDMLLDFYRGTLADAGANACERDFLEGQLVTTSGLRNSVALDDAEKRYHVRRPVLDRLREARLLHFDDRALGHQRVELAHDVLCGVLLRARDERRAVLSRRRRVMAAAGVGVALIGVTIAFAQGWKEEKTRNSRAAVQEQLEVVDRKITNGQLDEAASALELARQLAVRSSTVLDLTDQRYQLRILSSNAHSLGASYHRKGETTKALAAFMTSLNADKTIAGLNPDDAEAQVSLAREYFWVGDELESVGDIAGALEAFRTSNDILQKLTKKNPDNASWQESLTFSHGRIGSVLEAQGDLIGALQAFHTSDQISLEFATKDPNNTNWQHRLAASHIRVARALAAQGNLSSAFQTYRSSNEIYQKLATQESDNASWQRDIAISHAYLGDILKKQGNLVDALQSYRTYNEFSQKLATKEPDNAIWQRDLGDSHAYLGDVLVARGDLAEALQAFRTSDNIFQELAAKDPKNTNRQYDLARSHSGLGSVLEAQGNLASALRAFSVSKEILGKLVARDPNNTKWQEALAGVHRHIGDALTKLSDLPAAIMAYRTALECIMPLVSRPAGPISWRSEIAKIRIGLGDALRLSGESESALRELQQAEKNMHAAADGSLEEMDYQGAQALVALRLGQTLFALKPPKTEEGLVKFKEGRDRLRGLKQRSGLDFYQEHWLVELEREIAKSPDR